MTARARPVVLAAEFFARPAEEVARRLLGSVIVSEVHGQRTSGRIVETEAYVGESDLACHARSGRTARNAVMYGPAGRAYVYFTYGNHWMLNVVTERAGFPAAVLIRAIQPLQGGRIISTRRNGRDTFGPGKLTHALGISRGENNMDLANPRSRLRIERGIEVPTSMVTEGPRVGLSTVPEPWKSKPWRFLVKGWRLGSGDQGSEVPGHRKDSRRKH